MVNIFLKQAKTKGMKRILSIFYAAIFAIILGLSALFLPISCKKTYAEKNLKYLEAQFQTPVMSIVIDDFGSYDQSGVETILTCKAPLTCAVIPNVDNSKNNIDEILAHGHELILHMPMQAHVNLPESWYGPTYISNSDSRETLFKKIDKCLEKFPKIKGFNMHIGSGVGRNEALMSAVYDYANSHGLYFLDSRTIETNATIEACKKTGSTYLGRDVFLEPEKNRSYTGVKSRLLEGANLAIQDGYSIVIGHVGAEGGENTAKAILDTVDEIEKMGIKIVPLSSIYENLKMAKTA